MDFVSITHLFSLVSFASFLTGLSNLSLGKRNTDTNTHTKFGLS